MSLQNKSTTRPEGGTSRHEHPPDTQDKQCSVLLQTFTSFGMLSQLWEPLEIVSGKDQPQAPGIFRFIDSWAYTVGAGEDG